MPEPTVATGDGDVGSFVVLVVGRLPAIPSVSIYLRVRSFKRLGRAAERKAAWVFALLAKKAGGGRWQ